jgi:hypothetical protein
MVWIAALRVSPWRNIAGPPVKIFWIAALEFRRGETSLWLKIFFIV